ncbi:hypothetical protein MANY_01280 [Mycolicibacterium anyangense]|uniref:Uncharacterized protein n=2 Tax=Mycolicibacterium anyangense TaxID=1431246 RepID=A0A6N4W5R6_9MYCO|nr:hypothetical protein MANY_01280 [Mycolicibacterium anyangense]
MAVGLMLGFRAAPAEAVEAWECDIMMPAADRIETALNMVSPNGTPFYVAGQLRNALSPLYGLTAPTSVDLRIRSVLVAADIDNSDPYRPASPEQLATDLATARQDLAAVRADCAP